MTETGETTEAPSRRTETDLTSGPIGSTLLIFALPVLGSNVLQSINGSVNSIWVGRLIGEQALAATSNANLVMMLLLGAVFGVGMAATIMVGQAVGRRDLHGARKVVGTAATFFFVVSVICAALGWVYCEAILRLLATPDDVLPLAVDYLRVIFLAVPGMNFLAFLMSVLRGAGDSRTPFWFMFLSVVLDIILNPLLIGGYGPFPAMGIAGSALATLVGSLVPLVGLIVTIYWRNDPLRLAGPDFVLLKPDPAMLRVIISKGVPIGLQMVVISVSALTLMGMVNSYGTHVTAAYGVAAQLWTYVQMPAMAIGAGVSSMAAQNIGAGRWDRVGQITRAGVTFNLVLTTLLVGVLFLFDRHMLGWFLPASS
ncbi:MATE family efflux transporter, partial [Escherichia coli]|nr:MATE family efflux transporter [Escherichia coli]